MDPHRFDALVRFLETSGARRDALRLAVGALAGLGGTQAIDAEAARRRDRSDRADSASGAASHGRRHCAAGLTRCKIKRRRHRCVDLQTDADNCGQCRNRCPADQPCVAGECGCTSRCQGCCDGSTCVTFDQQTDQECGFGGLACTACAAGSFCDGGNCGCIGAGGACDPAGPEHCCPSFSATCNSGSPQPNGVCCIQDGGFCIATNDRGCLPNSGCCCSGFCGADNLCAEPS